MRKRLLITDVDNTLFDWQELWYQSFSAMIDTIIAISGVERSLLLAECSVVHQRHGTSEYSYLIEELPCLAKLYNGDIISHMQPAIDAFRQARRLHLKLYPDVLATLKELRERGVTIAAFTESKAFYTNYRFRKLELDGPVGFLYSPSDHDLPVANVNAIRHYPLNSYKLKYTSHRHTADGEVKPNPHLLSTIVEELGFAKPEVVYLGDSALKDVFMAQSANVLDVHAAYGLAQRRPEYELLRAVTHWTPEMVEREKHELSRRTILPSVSLNRGFAEITHFFE